MRVWVYPEKQYEDLGAERWEVEWHEVPGNWALMTDDQREECNPEGMVCRHQYFRGPKAEQQALKVAAKQCKHRASAFGCATVTRQVVDWYVEEDRVAEWTDVGETVYLP